MAALPAQAGGVPATVLSIGDGDTLRLRDGSRIRTVRLACIDAPETSQAPQGASARAALQALAPVGSALELRIQATDRYGSSVAELFRGGRNLNQALMASGAAFTAPGDLEQPRWDDATLGRPTRSPIRSVTTQRQRHIASIHNQRLGNTPDLPPDRLLRPSPGAAAAGA